LILGVAGANLLGLGQSVATTTLTDVFGCAGLSHLLGVSVCLEQSTCHAVAGQDQWVGTTFCLPCRT